MSGKLALLGGVPAVTATEQEQEDLFRWPIVTKEEEDAVLDVLRKGSMSATDVTRQFEAEFAAWQGTRYALGYCNGTAALHAAMFACGLGEGDEIICPSVTYWASITQAFSFGATPVFAEIDPQSLCIDPKDLERCISPNTKAIMVVHYLAHPADMDPIMEIANKHNIKVIEDVSHAQGGLYKGRMLGTIGHIAAMSLMSGKSLVAGEAGMIVTNDLELYERAIAFGHYERFNDSIQTEYLKPYQGISLGGYKGRVNQFSSAVGRIQLKHYDERIVEIRKAMNYFWDLLKDVPGLRAHRVNESTGSNMAGWYAPHGIYVPEELGGLSVTRFAQAVSAEGSPCSPGCNSPLHTHRFFHTCDLYHAGKPSRIAHAQRDVRELDRALTISDTIGTRTYSIPWFKHMNEELIRQHANAYRKAAENYKELLADDPGNPDSVGMGNWYFYRDKDDTKK